MSIFCNDGRSTFLSDAVAVILMQQMVRVLARTKRKKHFPELAHHNHTLFCNTFRWTERSPSPTPYDGKGMSGISKQ
jgi:hypothetical protein